MEDKHQISSKNGLKNHIHGKAENTQNPNQQKHYHSPKFFRRKPDKSRIIQKTKDEISEVVCYISPKKSLENLHSHTDSNASLLALCGSPRSRVSKRQSVDVFDESISQKEISIGGVTSIERNEKLEERNEELERKVRENEGKISRLSQQNSYCLSKIQELSVMLNNNHDSLNKLQKQIDQKNDLLKKMEGQLSCRQKEIFHLEQTISHLNKSLLEKKFTFSMSEDTDDGEKSSFYAMQLEAELEEYKRINIELNEKLKYYSVNEYMYKKVLTDYQQQQNKNERLKHLNKKLIRKLDVLESEKRRKSKMGNDNSISFEFELSPGK